MKTAEEIINEKVFESLGQASMCWFEDEVFDSRQADEIGINLLEKIMEYAKQESEKAVREFKERLLQKIDFEFSDCNCENNFSINNVTYLIEKLK